MEKYFKRTAQLIVVLPCLQYKKRSFIIDKDMVVKLIAKIKIPC